MGKHFEKDIFKPLTFCNGKYQVSRFGKVKSVYSLSKYGNCKPTGTILKTTINKRGYEKVKLQWWEAGKCIRKTMAVHRLVAMTFHPNPENKPQVNHKDLNPLNNDYRNLEWCTAKENTNHAQANGRMPIKVPYVKKGRPEGIKQVYHIDEPSITFSVKELSKKINTTCHNIHRQLNGERYCYLPYRYVGGESLVRFKPVKIKKEKPPKKERPPRKVYVPHPRPTKNVIVMDKLGNQVDCFLSYRKAADWIGTKPKTFKKWISVTTTNYHKGYYFKYA